MSNDAVFTLKLEPELRADFLAAVASDERSAAQVLCDLMRSYVNQQRSSSEYESFLQGKVDNARKQREEGLSTSNEDAEQEAAQRRRQLLLRIKESRA